MKRPTLVAIGAAHPDRRGQAAAPFVSGVSNPGMFREEMGGAAFNALRNASRHGIDCTMISVRGGDASGQAVAAAIAQAGIADRSVTFLDRQTPGYMAVLDSDGALVGAIADMALYESALPRIVRRSSVRHDIDRADAVLVDANLPPEALMHIARLAHGKPLHAIGTSAAKVRRLQAILPLGGCLFLNRSEAETLAGTRTNVAHELAARDIGSFVITAGEMPVMASDSATLFEVDPPFIDRVSDVTGAGDALAGTTIAFRMLGHDFGDALRAGMAAAGLTISSPSAVAEYEDADLQTMMQRIGPLRSIAKISSHEG